ncbi:OmpA family protein [uncultured Croceitalea sp.]|uniref:OmpA family protein n=1 Tax=uncultured Croceitalea sp. TaxID=1798908 RepID=UPI003306697E
MKPLTSLLIFFFGISAMLGQDRRSKGDDYFFEYSYKEAIEAYQSDINEGLVLSPNQELNLADSYFKTGAFEKATEIYLQYYTNDTVMNSHRFNKLLQGLSKTSKKERIQELLASEHNQLSNESKENAEFNNDLLNADNESEPLNFEVFNLGGNSPQGDFSPTFYNNGLLFTSGRPIAEKSKFKPTGEGYLDIFNADINADGQISNPQQFNEIQSSKYHKATPYYSKELNSIFYVLSNTDDDELEFDENGKNALAIGAQKIGGSFRFLWRDLSTSFYYPFYDAETGRLYFAANFKDGYGGTDIYYVNTNGGNIMSAPINLGPRINSPGNEIAPYIFENSLYFSSDVFYGFGGMDVYKSNFESSDKFSIPVNLGAEINSEEDDFGFIIRNEGDGLLGYFSSNRNGGQGKDDIYGFLVDEKPGLKTLTLKGKIFDETDGGVIANTTVQLLDASGAEVLSEMVSDGDGNYRVEIPWKDEVILRATKERHSTYVKRIQLATGQEQQTVFDVDIDLMQYDDLVEEKEGQTVLKLRKFYFQKSRSSLTPDITKELDKVVRAVTLFPQLQLRIETHTDSRGGGSTNFRLTQQRSDAIKRYLIDKGVSNSNILYSVGYGEDKILNNCKNGVYCIEMLHKQNQRSLFVVLNDNVLFN